MPADSKKPGVSYEVSSYVQFSVTFALETGGICVVGSPVGVVSEPPRRSIRSESGVACVGVGCVVVERPSSIGIISGAGISTEPGYETIFS